MKTYTGELDTGRARGAATAPAGVTGYRHPSYAASLAGFGEPRHLAGCDGWVLERPIGTTGHRDAMGPYPLFFCGDWRRVAGDLADLAGDLVSVVVVTGPFCGAAPALAGGCFDRVVHFKDHYVADLARPPERFVRASHRSHARRALRDVRVEIVDAPWERLGTWRRLFDNLVRRHSISGIRAFSEAAFAEQLRVPGLVMFEAAVGTEVVGLDLWYVQGDVAYGHLAAFSDLGYEVGASYATKWTMLNEFYGKLRWVDLAGTAGLVGGVVDGLARFKAGWATGTRPAYLASRVLQPVVYRELAHRRGATGAPPYFPEYRRGEFA